MKNSVENFIYYKYLLKVAVKFPETQLYDPVSDSLKLNPDKMSIESKWYNKNVYFYYTIDVLNIFTHHYWLYTSSSKEFPHGFLWKDPQNEQFHEDPLAFLLAMLYYWSNYKRNFIISFCDFFEHYPKVNLMFYEVEFKYIDLWLEVPKFIEELLFELSERDNPFIEKYKENMCSDLSKVLSWEETVYMLPPLEENINFEKHFEEYFFGDGAHPQLSNMLSFYLENRLELKTLCEESWKKDKLLNENLTNDLNIYFLCNYSLKGLSNYTLRFIAANSELNLKNPLKPFREHSQKAWRAFSPEQQRKYKEMVLITNFNKWKAKTDW